jgi:hypothetical protein
MQSRKAMITPMHTTAPATAIPAIVPADILRWLKACEVSDGVLEPNTLNVKVGFVPKTVVAFPEDVVADITESRVALAEGIDDPLVTADGMLWLGLGWSFTDWMSFDCSGGEGVIVPSL